MEIGLILAAARRRAGLAQKDVALCLGISASYLSDIEKGRRLLSEDRISLLPMELQPALAQAMIAVHQRAIEKLRDVHQRGIDKMIAAQ